ncbi:MAG: M23 family metallopeptidase [Ruminococcaceae bacterium]|nr:M23 family metallopeptidase [Oscillospiraceae bacterium]
MKRRISFIVIGLAIVLIPTFIMLSFYLSNRNIPVEIRNAEEVILLTPDEKTVKAVSNGENDDLLKLLCEMTVDAKSVEKLPQEAEACKLFRVTFRTEHSSLIYKFYFGENPAYCYFVTDGGAVRRINTEKARQFLGSEFSETVYTYALGPTVTLNGVPLVYQSLDWEYRLIDGTYRKASCCVKQQKVDPMDLGTLTEALQIKSDLPADSVIVNAYDESGALLYTGDGSGIEQLEVEKPTEIGVTVILEWKKDDEGKAPFAGRAEYTALTRKYPPAAFAVSHREVQAGQTFILSGSHVKDPSGVKITVEPDVDFQARFVTEGSEVKALMTLGFPEDYEMDTDYRISLHSDEWKEPMTFTVTVKGKKYGEFRDYVSKETLGQTFSPGCKNEFLECMKEIMSQPSIYTSEKGRIDFTDAVVTPDGTRSYQYGSKVIIHATKAEYRALDTMYCTYGASKPVAVADGRVLYVGESALTGKLLVIDHGQGVRSWYCNLSEISVSAGQNIKMGDVIGKCLGGGFNGQGGLNMHVALTLENTALDLKWAIQNGIEY